MRRCRPSFEALARVILASAPESARAVIAAAAYVLESEGTSVGRGTALLVISVAAIAADVPATAAGPESSVPWLAAFHRRCQRQIRPVARSGDSCCSSRNYCHCYRLWEALSPC